MKSLMLPHHSRPLLLGTVLGCFAVATALALPPADFAKQPDVKGDREPREVAPQPRQNSVSQPGQAPVAFSDRLHTIVGRAGGGPNPARALIVLSSSTDPKLQANLQEDLAVMYHIIDKTAEESLGKDQRLRKALGVDVYFAPDSGQLRSAYLEGYGALFLLRVNFPLLPGPSEGEAQKEEPAGSSAWEEARQEVFGEPGGGGMAGVPAGEPYSEEKISRLKSSLLEALKNAGNIRDLKQDEAVTIYVSGGPKAGPGKMRMSARRAGQSDDGIYVVGQAGGAAQNGTILTIRAKKGDIDAFGKGAMNLDEFRRKALVATYEGDAGGAFGPFAGFGGSAYGYGYSRK